ncbi:hypothetical protein GUITHDRAFT_153496, partial [Guillardia theta CCMP2712]
MLLLPPLVSGEIQCRGGGGGKRRRRLYAELRKDFTSRRGRGSFERPTRAPTARSAASR